MKATKHNKQPQGADRVQKYRPRTGELQDTIIITGTLSQLPERQFFDTESGSEAGILKQSGVNYTVFPYFNSFLPVVSACILSQRKQGEGVSINEKTSN